MHLRRLLRLRFHGLRLFELMNVSVNEKLESIKIHMPMSYMKLRDIKNWSEN